MSDLSQPNMSAKSSQGDWLRSVARQYALHIALLGLIILSAVLSPSFLSSGNLTNMLLQYAPLGIVVIGQVFVILVRGLDLSAASVMATAAVIATSFNSQNSDAIPIIGAVLAIVLQGLRSAYTQGARSGNVPSFFRVLGSESLMGVPYNLIVTIVVATLFSILLAKSAFGRRVYITGGNPETARLLGMKADRTIIICYMISGSLAALAGLILSGFVGIVDNWVGRGFEIDSIVAAVVGGVALSGGRGSITGGLLGAAILVVVFNSVLQLGLPIQLQIIIKGVTIIVAAAFYARRGA
jgi:ribose/xylose/arabinose/galactoside ABC-type transport system permease subunit